jgi:hypothetical protein
MFLAVHAVVGILAAFGFSAVVASLLLLTSLLLLASQMWLKSLLFMLFPPDLAPCCWRSLMFSFTALSPSVYVVLLLFTSLEFLLLRPAVAPLQL